MNFSPPLRQLRAASEPPPSPPPPPRTPPAHSFAEREWNPMGAVLALIRSGPRIAGFVLLVLALTGLALSQWPKRYTAEALVLLDPRIQPNLQLEAVLSGLAPDDQTISSEILVLRSGELAAMVVGDLALAREPFFNPALRKPPGILEFLLPGSTAPAADAQPPEAALELEELRILNAFARRLSVERAERSHAIRIAMTAATPEQAADIANRLAQRYLEGQLSAKFEANDLAQAWLNQRVAELQENVQGAEQAVEEYRARFGLLDSNGVTVTTQQMAQINGQLITARSETAAARARLVQVQRLVQQQGDALSAAEVLSSPLIHRLKEQEVEVLRRRADLSQEYGARHPRLQSVEAELADIRDKIMAEVRQIVAGLNNELAVTLAQEQALARDLGRLETMIAEQNQAQVQLRALEREAEASRNLLATFLERFKETTNQDAIQRPDARILSRALPPLEASSPRVLLVLAASAALALAIACGIVLVAPAFRLGIRSPADFGVRLGLPVLAALPGKPWWPVGRAAHDGLAEANGPSAEAMHGLALGLGMARDILIAPAAPNDTSGEVALALARSFARAGERVLLVDGDFRNARLTWRLSAEHEPGFAELLRNPDCWPVPTLPDPLSGRLRILTAGSESERARLLLSPAMAAATLPVLQGHFERIVISGPALAEAGEALALAAAADATVVLLHWDGGALPAAEQALVRIGQVGGSARGVVLTGVPRRLAGRESGGASAANAAAAGKRFGFAASAHG